MLNISKWLCHFICAEEGENHGRVSAELHHKVQTVKKTSGNVARCHMSRVRLWFLVCFSFPVSLTASQRTVHEQGMKSFVCKTTLTLRLQLRRTVDLILLCPGIKPLTKLSLTHQ